MAEIKIEKKKPVWPWIIAILLIAALVYYVYFNDHTTRGEGTTTIKSAVPADTIGN